LANLAFAIAETNATIEYDSLPPVSVNATQLRQLFQNLVGNALKYHRPGIAPVVKATTRREKGAWIFSVRDNGLGIEPEFRAHLGRIGAGRRIDVFLHAPRLTIRRF
jgi:light-regulated signal transduction histidine kinase (bacteriophytochrome)